MMAIERVTYFKCPHCGAEFEEEGHAKTCEELHVHMHELEMAGTVGVLENGKAYTAGVRLPEMILIRGVTKDVKAYYRLFRETDTTVTHVPADKGKLQLGGGDVPASK